MISVSCPTYPKDERGTGVPTARRIFLTYLAARISTPGEAVPLAAVKGGPTGHQTGRGAPPDSQTGWPDIRSSRRRGVGPASGGTNQLATKLLAANGVTTDTATLITAPLPDYVDALESGRADAGFLVPGPEARTNDDSAVVDVHSKPLIDAKSETALFSRAAAFPVAADPEFPLADEARRVYRSGPPFLQRCMPFWLATMLDRLVVMLVPIIGLAIPTMRFAPLL
jgi:hypothetical protein